MLDVFRHPLYVSNYAGIIDGNLAVTYCWFVSKTSNVGCSISRGQVAIFSLFYCNVKHLQCLTGKVDNNNK